MICGEGTAVIDREPEEILEFVMDLHSYRKVDAKLGKIKWVKRDGDVAYVKFRPKLRNLPSPFLATQRVTMTPGKRIDVENAPSWMNRLAGFKGEFVCTRADSGTLVRRKICFTFAPPLKWLLEPYLRNWLASDLQVEVDATKKYLEAGRLA